MKKSLLALAALTAFAGVASAQSSVTLFGVVDLGIRSVDNDNGSRTVMSQDGNASSRLGFRGVEDLGGGLRAGFWIEGAINPDNGTAGGQSWQRRSTVSLMGGFGELRLGRDYTPTFWNHTVFDPFGTVGVASQTNLMGGASVYSTFVRANNTVGYFLPAMGGVYGQVQVGLDEGEAAGSDIGYVGGRIGYAAGPVNVAVAYGETKPPHPASGPTSKVGNIGGSFNMGFMTLMGQYHEYKAGSHKLNNFLLGANVPLGSGTLKFSGAQSELKLASGAKPKSTQFAVGYVYDLSKRTALYATGSVIDNDTGLGFVAGGGGKARAPVTGFSSTGYEFGVRHSF
ncbi:MAG: porin [Rubrivivax sp.]|nr:porin [Rubrivivax sp.]